MNERSREEKACSKIQQKNKSVQKFYFSFNSSLFSFLIMNSGNQIGSAILSFGTYSLSSVFYSSNKKLCLILFEFSNIFSARFTTITTTIALDLMI